MDVRGDVKITMVGAGIETETTHVAESYSNDRERPVTVRATTPSTQS
jgi:hypothetical protein